MPKDKKDVKDLTVEELNTEVTKTAQDVIDTKMDDVNSKFEKIEGDIKNVITEDDLKKETEKFQLKGVDGLKLSEKELEQVNKIIEEKLGPDAKIIKDITDLGNEVQGLKETGLIVHAKKKPINSKKGQAAEILKHMLTSEEYTDLAGKDFDGSTLQYSINREGEVKSKKDMLKDKKAGEKAVSITSDHTGTVMISEVVQNVEDIPLRKTHIRDLMTVRPTASSNIVAPQVTDYTDAFTQGAIMVAENTEAGLSVFKTEENTWGVKRIARAMEISKRYMHENGLSWVMNWILSRLPDQVQNVEDFQMLFGDGAGNNIKGLTKEAQTFGTLTTDFAAASMSSVATYDSGDQVLITFAAAHGLRNGDNIIIAASTNYNGTYNSLVVQNQFTILIDATYVAEATAAWTATGNSFWYQNVPNAQEFDVLSVGKALLEAGEYYATGIVLHPSAVEKLGLLKGTDAHYVGVSRDSAGRLNVNALPIATTTAMPAGHFLIGDFQRAVELAEYTPLSIQISSDSTDKKKNQVTVIIEEEIIFPIYNKLWFIYGKFATAIEAIDDPGTEEG